jgi:hypothetical protein
MGLFFQVGPTSGTPAFRKIPASVTSAYQNGFIRVHASSFVANPSCATIRANWLRFVSHAPAAILVHPGDGFVFQNRPNKRYPGFPKIPASVTSAYQNGFIRVHASSFVANPSCARTPLPPGPRPGFILMGCHRHLPEPRKLNIHKTL